MSPSEITWQKISFSIGDPRQQKLFRQICSGRQDVSFRIFMTQQISETCGRKQPTNPFHPGEVLLEEFLSSSGITQVAFAEKVGWTKARLNELIKGTRGITAEAALDLAEALGTSARLWMNLQATFDLAQAEERRRRKAAYGLILRSRSSR